jgi:UDP-glucose 4-epimerase
VVVWDNLSEGHRSAVHPHAGFLQGDLADRDLLFRATREHRPDAVIHFAGKALVPESMRDPSIYYQVNVSGGINLLVDKLVPELQRRGLFRSEYEGKTLRENLGLRRPPDLSHRG